MKIMSVNVFRSNETKVKRKLMWSRTRPSIAINNQISKKTNNYNASNETAVKK